MRCNWLLRLIFAIAAVLLLLTVRTLAEVGESRPSVFGLFRLM